MAYWRESDPLPASLDYPCQDRRGAVLLDPIGAGRYQLWIRRRADDGSSDWNDWWPKRPMVFEDEKSAKMAAWDLVGRCDELDPAEFHIEPMRRDNEPEVVEAIQGSAQDLKCVIWRRSDGRFAIRALRWELASFTTDGTNDWDEEWAWLRVDPDEWLVADDLESARAAAHDELSRLQNAPNQEAV